MFCFAPKKKGKRDTTLSYHTLNIAILQVFMFHIAYYCVGIFSLFALLLSSLSCIFLIMNCLSTLPCNENIYIIWSKCVHESFFYRFQLSLKLLEDKQLAKLGGSWYVQNVSTFLNTFAIVSPHICVVLNATNPDWRCFQQNCPGVLFLCRNSTFGEKSRKIGKPIIFTEDSRSQKMECRRALGGPDMAQARPSHWPRLACVWCPQAPPRSPLAAISSSWRETYGGFEAFPGRSPLRCHHAKPYSGDQKLRSGTLPGRGIGGDHRHRHHQHLSINHPWFPHPCVSSSRCRLKGMVGIGWDRSCNSYELLRA